MPAPDIPTIIMGAFRDPNGVGHIAPSIEGLLMKGHRLSLHCACAPKLDVTEGHLIIIHEVIH